MSWGKGVKIHIRVNYKLEQMINRK